VIIIANIAVDQASKLLAIAYLAGKGKIQIVGDLFIFYFARNTGAFLSLGQDWPEVFRIFILMVMPTLVLAGIIIFILINIKLTRFERFALAFIAGGGISNVFDRILRGSVVDFMNFGIGNLRTGILNIADLSLTFGVIVLFIYTLLRENRAKREKDGN